jgi:hypothetical protein
MYSMAENAETCCVLVMSRSAEVIIHLLLSIVVISFALVVVLAARSFIRDLLVLTKHLVIAYINVREQLARRIADPGGPRRSVSRNAAPTTALLF